jgi:threonine dehydrogenase-like Zn-dependent dehydrogenase
MRAVQCREGTIHVVDRPPPAGDGVRVKVKACGICGSDLHMQGGFPPDRIPGHEIAGELTDGTPVAVEPLAPCESCDYCAAGEYQLCRDGARMVLGVARDGGMAEEILVPERALVPLAPGLPVRDACLVEPLAVAMHGLRRISVGGGERVAIVGGGAIGQCAVAAAAARGCEVALFARHDAQREAGDRLGAKVPSGEYDVVIDAAGTQSSLQEAAIHTRPGGTMLLIASYWEGMSLPGMIITLKEITVVPASMYGRDRSGRDIDHAAALLADRPRIADAIITHRLPLEAAREAFEAARDRKAGSIKVVLEP